MAMDLDFNSGAGGGEGVFITNNSEAGGGAAFFDGGSFLSYSSAPASVLATLGSSFTLSVWLETTNIIGNDGDPAFYDQGIVTADVPITTRDIVPMALTGSGIGFNTGDDPNRGQYGDQTLSSYADVADGNYHHVVVTRDEATGVKQIYVDGALSASDTATTYFLHAPVEVGVGAQIDASQSDPNNAINGGPFYQGLMDDMQIYNRYLTADEINYLYQNPGSIVTNAPPDPVDISLSFDAYRETVRPDGDYYILFPDTSFDNPAPTTTNIVLSPYGDFGAYEWPGNGYGFSYDVQSFDDFLTEITGDYWTIAINAGATNEQIFHFMVSVSGLDTNVFGRALISTPVAGAIRVPMNTPFEWTGPTNFDSINVYLNDADGTQEASDSLDVTATSWPSPPEPELGTNTLNLYYDDYDFNGFIATAPMNTLQQPMDNWSYGGTLTSQDSIPFVVGGGTAQPVTLVNFSLVPDGLQFSFQSQGGATNIVQASTNLATGLWKDVTNFVGDGNLWTFVYPTNSPPVRFFRVESQ